LEKIIPFWIITNGPLVIIKAVNWLDPELVMAPMISKPNDEMILWLNYYGNPTYNHFGSDKQNVLNLYKTLGEWPQPLITDVFEPLEAVYLNDSLDGI